MSSFEKIGINIFINGVAQFSRDIGYIVSGYLRYERAMSSLERRVQSLGNSEIRLANQHARSAGKEYSQSTKAVQLYSNQLRMLDQEISKLILDQDRYTRAIASAQKAFESHKVRAMDLLARGDIAGSQKAEGLATASANRRIKAEDSLYNTTAKLIQIQRQFDSATLSLVQSQDKEVQSSQSLVNAQNEQIAAQEKLSANTAAIQGAMDGLGGFLETLTKGFGSSITLTGGLGDKLALTAPQIAAVTIALNALKIGLDVFVYAARFVIRILQTLWEAFSTVVGWVWNLGKQIGGFLINQLWKLVTFPFKIVANGFNSILNAIKQIFIIFTGVGLSNYITNLASKIRQFASGIFDFTVNLQLMKIQLAGLVAREMVMTGATKTMAEAMGVASIKAKELYKWTIELAITSPFTIEEVNKAMLLGYSYGFTTERVKELTRTIVEFGAGMGIVGEGALVRIIENFGQMRAAGKLTGTELRDLARGSFIPLDRVLKMVGEKFNKTPQQIRDLGKFGKLLTGQLEPGADALYEIDAAMEGMPVEEFINAFMEVVKIDFPGILDRVSGSFQVASSNVGDFAKYIGSTLLLPALDEVSFRLQNFIVPLFKNKEFNKAFEDFGISIGKTTGKIMDFWGAFQKPFFDRWIQGAKNANSKFRNFNAVFKDWIGGGKIFNIIAIKDGGKEIMKFAGALNYLNKYSLVRSVQGMLQLTGTGKTLEEALGVMAKSGDEAEKKFGKLGLAMYNMWQQGDLIGFLKATNDMLVDVMPEFKQFYTDVIAPLLEEARESVFSWLNAQLSNLYGWLSTNAQQIADWIGGVIGGSFDILVRKVSGVSAPMDTLLGDVQAVMTEIGKVISATIGSLPQAIGTTVEGGTMFSNGGFKEFMGQEGEPAGPTRNGLFESIKKLALDAKLAVLDLVNEGFNVLLTKIETQVDAVFPGLRSGINELITVLKDKDGTRLTAFLDSIVTVAKFSVQIGMLADSLGRLGLALVNMQLAIAGMSPIGAGKSGEGKGFINMLIEGWGNIGEIGSVIINKIADGLEKDQPSTKAQGRLNVALLKFIGKAIKTSWDNITQGEVGVGQFQYEIPTMVTPKITYGQPIVPVTITPVPAVVTPKVPPVLDISKWKWIGEQEIPVTIIPVPTIVAPKVPPVLDTSKWKWIGEQGIPGITNIGEAYQIPLTIEPIITTTDTTSGVDTLTNMTGNIQSAWTLFWQEMNQPVTSWNALVKPFSDAYNELWKNSIVPEMMTNIYNTIVNTMTNIGLALPDVIGKITKLFQDETLKWVDAINFFVTQVNFIRDTFSLLPGIIVRITPVIKSHASAWQIAIEQVLRTASSLLSTLESIASLRSVIGSVGVTETTTGTDYGVAGGKNVGTSSYTIPVTVQPVVTYLKPIVSQNSSSINDPKFWETSITQTITVNVDVYDQILSSITEKQLAIIAADKAITDGISSNWQQLLQTLVTQSIVPDMMTGILTIFTDNQKSITESSKVITDSIYSQWNSISIIISRVANNLSRSLYYVRNLPDAFNNATPSVLYNTDIWLNALVIIETTVKSIYSYLVAIAEMGSGKTGTGVGGGGGGGGVAKSDASLWAKLKAIEEEKKNTPFGKASGGTVSSNGAYIVGEVGPELFLPRYPGFIVPTSKILQALQLASTPVNTPTLGKSSYTNASTQMNFYGPQYFNVPTGMDMVTLFRGAKA